MAIPFTLAVTFDETANPPVLIVEDTTDYAGLSIDTTDLADKLQVTLQGANGNSIVYPFPSGAVYDIPLPSSLFNQYPIALPLDSDGEVLEGTYAIALQLWDTTSIAPTSNGATFTYLYKKPCPEIEIENTVDCAASTVTAKDVTNYGSYVTSLARVMTVYPPPVLLLSPYVTSQDTLTVTGIYTKTWTTEVISTITYTYPTFTVMIVLSGIKEFDVECDSDGCKILCCLKNLTDTYNKLLGVNPTAAQLMYDQKIGPVIQNVTLFQLNRSCGDGNKAAYYLQKVIDISGCTDDCKGCGSNDEPTPVIPTTPSNSIAVVNSPDNSLDVTSTTVGNTITYHVQISAALQALIAAQYNTTVDTSTPSFITVTPSGANPKNYRVNYTGDTPHEFGYPYTYSSANTASDPGAGKVKYNNANLALATAIYISATDFNTYVTGIVAEAGLSTTPVKSYITIRKATDPTKFATYAVTAVTDNTGWYTLAVTYLFANAAAPFTNLDKVYATFNIIGDAGHVINYSHQVFSSTSVVASGNTGGVPATQKSTNVSHLYFDNNGDVLVIDADCRLATAGSGSDIFQLVVTGFATIPVVLGWAGATARIHLEFTRTSATTFSITGYTIANSTIDVLPISGIAGFATGIPIPITLQASTTAGDIVTGRLFIESKPV